MEVPDKIMQMDDGNETVANEASIISNQQARQRSVLVTMPRTPGTLNFATRKAQIQRINNENLNLLKTLQATKPTLSFEGWRQHARKYNQYKRNISMAVPIPNKLV